MTTEQAVKTRFASEAPNNHRSIILVQIRQQTTYRVLWFFRSGNFFRSSVFFRSGVFFISGVFRRFFSRRHPQPHRVLCRHQMVRCFVLQMVRIWFEGSDVSQIVRRWLMFRGYMFWEMNSTLLGNAVSETWHRELMDVVEAVVVVAVRRDNSL